MYKIWCFLLIPGRYLLCLMSVLVLSRLTLRVKSTRMLRIWALLSLLSHIARLCGTISESLYILLTTEWHILPNNKQINNRLPNNKQINNRLPNNKQINNRLPSNKQINNRLPNNKQINIRLPNNKQMNDTDFPITNKWMTYTSQ